MKKKVKKILKAVTAIKILTTCATVAVTVYSLIPKYEKIEGINEEALIKQVAEY